MSKRLLFITISFICVCSSMAQTSNSHLLFQYFGANENQSELNYISWVLESNNLTIPGPDQEEAIIEAHNFYLSHKEEIDMKFKAEELIQFRSAVKSAKAAGWAMVLSSIVSSLPTAFAAAQKQQEDYQKKINRDKYIQAYISQNLSSTPKHYTQNFGSTPVMTTSTPRTQVTTSNGFDEPLSSSNSYSTGQGTEIVGMLVSNGIQQNVRLKINGNVIVGRYVGGTVRSPWGEGWIQDNLQGMPTNIQVDGEWAKMYRNRASSRDIDNAIIYF